MSEFVVSPTTNSQNSKALERVEIPQIECTAIWGSRNVTDDVFVEWVISLTHSTKS